MPPSYDGESCYNSSAQVQSPRVSKTFTLGDEENAPLLAGPSTPNTRLRRHTQVISEDTISRDLEQYSQLQQSQHNLAASDDSYLFDLIMEKVKATKFAHFVDKLAVESEPGLSNAQLMLHNHDLKPGKNYVFTFRKFH